MNLLIDPGLAATPQTPLICFSHLRWDFVLQRPQHLMARFAAARLLSGRSLYEAKRPQHDTIVRG